MIQLQAYTDSGVTTLDISQITTISLNFSVAELGDVTTRNSPFSQTFRLPQSEKNNKFFEHWYNANISTATFDARKKTRVVIMDEGVLVIAGYLQLLAVYESDRTYEVAVYGDAANLFQELKDKDLKKVFETDGVVTTDYDYQANAANTIDSWDIDETTGNDITDGAVGNGTLTIPVIDWGTNQNYPLHYTTGSSDPQGLGEEDFLRANRLKPGIRLQHLFQKVLNKAGYTYTSTFLDSDKFKRIYMQLGTNAPELQTRPFFGCNIGLSSSFPITGGSTGQILPLTVETGDFYDPDNLWDNTAYSFVAPTDMLVYPTVRVAFSYSGSGSGSGVIAINGPNNTELGGAVFLNATTNTANAEFTPSSPIELAQGEELQCFVFVTGLTSGTISVQPSNTVGTGTYQTAFYLGQDVPGNGYDATSGDVEVHLPTLVPDIKQEEFVKDIIQRFNLVLEASPDNERHLIIEPFSDWLDQGTGVDWTHKLDLLKERTLKPTTEYKDSTILLGDLDGEDEGNRYWQEHQGYGYGQYREVIDDDFASGELKNDPIFKPFHVNKLRILGSDQTALPNVAIGRNYKIEDGQYTPIADKPFLYFHNGTYPTGATLYIDSTSFTSYPYVSAFSDGPNDEDTESLYWGYQYPYGYGLPVVGDTYVQNTLHRVYWARFLNQIYNRDARILEAYFYLTPTDLLNLRFNSLINVEGVHYRLQKVEGYVVNGYETTKCTLLKDQGALRYPTNERCDLIPYRYYLDGTIGFVNPETGATTLNPGEECCTLAGGTFQDDLCFWRRPRDGGQVPQLTNDTRERSAYDSQVNQENLRFAPIGINSGTRRTSFFATVEEGATAVASEDGTGVGLLQIPVNTVVSGTINVNTVQTTYDGTNGSLGSASYLQYSFKAQNIEGTITADITEHTSARIKDTDATGGRGVAISVSRKSSDLAQLHTDLTLTCTGENYARVNFALDLILNYVDITNAVVDQDTLLHEDGLNIATENNTKLKE